MKIACVYFPRFLKGGGKFHYVHQALVNLGHDVRHIQEYTELTQADSECDLILFEQRQPGSIDPNQIAAMRSSKSATWVQWYFDLNYLQPGELLTDQAIWPTFGPVMRAMDLVCVKERSKVPEYQQNGINAIWMDQGCPSTMEQAVLQESPEFSVITWGSFGRFWRQRTDDIFFLADRGFKIGWASVDGISQHPNITQLPYYHPDQLPNLISRGKVVLHVDAFDSIDGFYSDRIWLSGGAGACNVRRITAGQGALPAYGYMHTDQLLAIVMKLCGDFRARRRAGLLSREQTMTHHTYEARCRELLSHVSPYINKRSQKQAVSAL